ncbi:t-complex protein1, epsilon-SU (nucleomorph) [Chroomonas mesostigmatica CCMP1168]|uniref:T-complex protein 1 subunit epsilon n=1 Tax=Chroomonas mesostigmatica CCMP1168 TaxID=1195612 RepID=J7G836_9CRYP|nr:t-complex protein1, epsilon-SU [Chroomonas mesostigmatica CCMP1168]|mmetsp:Transcript_59589/g.146361  ORF Transcript_59589/g.146361 Transcript_59589/m.146361 type:complete len:534 (+) Transcript_59589:129-1730(+)
MLKNPTEIEKNKRIDCIVSKGVNTIKENIKKVTEISRIIRSSFGPMGMDKIIEETKDNVTITNDGATILKKMMFEAGIYSMIVEIAESQDDEIGDGTTGIVLLVGALLEQAEKLIEKGIHPTRITEGFEHASSFCLFYLESISKSIDKKYNVYSCLIYTAMTAMNSKVINRSKKRLAEICIKAVLAISDINRKDINFELIKIDGKIGGNLENTTLVNGVVIDKDFSHSQMPKDIKDVRVSILTCPLEPPRPKTNHKLNIENIHDFKQLESIEQKYFKEMISQLKCSGTNLVFCQWGFDDEGNHLLLRNKLAAVRWVSGTEIELLAVSTGAQIIPRFNEINSSAIGFAARVRENCFGTTHDRILIVENCAKSKAVTIFVRGSSEFILNEAKRAIRDALCAIKNLIRDNRVLFGGGSAEMACSLKISDEAEKCSGLKHYVLQGFSESLKLIPTILAENAGYFPIESLSQLQIRQKKERNPFLGIDCFGNGISNMENQKVFETLLSKQQQIQMATQIANSILRIDDVININPIEIN